MFKFLFILGLVSYALYKFGSLFYRAGASSQQYREPRPRRKEGEIHIDSNPKNKKGSNFKGGDYVDYEEIK